MLAILLAGVAQVPCGAQECLDYANYKPWSYRIATGGVRSLVERVGDLYAIGEPSGRLRVIDQPGSPVERVLLDTTMAPISCLAARDSLLVVGLDYGSAGSSGRGFVTFDLSVPGDIHVVQSVSMVAGSYPQRAYMPIDCEFVGPLMLVTGWNDFARHGVWVFERGENGIYEQLGCWLGDYYRGIASRNGFCYLADENDGLIWYDLSVTPIPSESGRLNSPAISPADVLALGDKLYVAGVYGGISCFDLSQGPAPRYMWTVREGTGRMRLAAQGDRRLLASDRGTGAYSLDISNPTTPTVETRVTSAGGANDVTTFGVDLAAAATDSGICVWDPAVQPPSPVIPTPEILAWGLAKANGLMYAGMDVPAVGYDGLFVYGRGANGIWSTIGAVDLPMMPYFVKVSGNLAFCATQFFVLSYGGNLVDVSDPTAPRIVRAFEQECKDVAFAPGRLYVTGQELTVFDTTDTGAIQVLGALPMTAGAIEVSGGRAFVAVEDVSLPSRRGLRIISVAEPLDFTVLGTLDLPDRIQAVVVRDGVAYLGTTDRLVIADVSDPSLPVILGSVVLGRESLDLVVQDGVAYMATSRGVAVCDVSDPVNPRVLGSVLGEYVQQVCIADGVVSVVAGNRVVDLQPQCTASTPNFISELDAARAGALVSLTWRVSANGAVPTIRLTGHQAARSWLVPFEMDPGGRCSAVDESEFSASGGECLYRLSTRRPDGTWATLAEVTVASLPGMATRILGVHPNPFNASAEMEFNLGTSGAAKIDVYDLRGRQVAAILDRVLDAGPHVAVWDGLDLAGRPAPSGTYLFHFECDSVRQSVRVTLVK